VNEQIARIDLWNRRNGHDKVYVVWIVKKTCFGDVYVVMTSWGKISRYINGGLNNLNSKEYEAHPDIDSAFTAMIKRAEEKIRKSGYTPRRDSNTPEYRDINQYIRFAPRPSALMKESPKKFTTQKRKRAIEI